MSHIPERPKNSYRVTLTLNTAKKRLDQVLIEALREQKDDLNLKNISRTEFKDLFHKKRIRIKGQPATPSSSLAQGVTYVDILGFGET
jgi:23S rRNA-/tRNA-specific pseudouridylate synthase